MLYIFHTSNMRLELYEIFGINIIFNSIPGEPPTYRPLRPRSTSEAVSGIGKDDLHSSGSKRRHKTNPATESHTGGDRFNTASGVSPPHQDDDLDLSPPAAGISTLDFDPMSFQCSPPSATTGLQYSKDGNKWRKNVGCSSESEPASGRPQSPDISPVLSKGGKKVTHKQLSPKLRKKSFKTQADVQSASVSVPPQLASSTPADNREAPVADGKELKASYQHCSPRSTASQASAVTDLSQSAQNMPDPGQCCSSFIPCFYFVL